MAKVRGQLKSIWPDRTQYKPYAYNLEMQDVFVEVDVPEDELKTTTKGDITETTLTLNGFTCLLGNIADAIDTLHLASLRKRNTRLD